MAQQRLIRPLLEAYLAYKQRLDPRVALSWWRVLHRRCCSNVRIEQLLDLNQLFVGEARAHAARVGQLAVAINPQLQGTKCGARSPGCAVTDDHEIVALVDPDLEPLVRAAAFVFGRRLL